MWIFSNKTEKLKIGYVQTSPVFGDKEKNFEEVKHLLHGVKADLLVLPELFSTGYSFISKKEVRGFSETRHGLTADFLMELSKITDSVLVGGFIETDGYDVYNSLMVVYGSKVIGTYRKIHLFDREKLWFARGNRPPKVYDINGVKIGTMICFDWMFPEVCRTLAMQGMQVLAHPANLVMPWCQSAMVTRCIENRVFAVTANRIGNEERGGDDLTFTGASQITSPDGKILSGAPVSDTGASVIVINEKSADNKMINEYNDVIKDRRPSLY